MMKTQTSSSYKDYGPKSFQSIKPCWKRRQRIYILWHPEWNPAANVAQILWELLNDVQDSFFSTTCDEYTDISNNEQLTLFIRLVDVFLGFMSLIALKAEYQLLEIFC